MPERVALTEAREVLGEDLYVVDDDAARWIAVALENDRATRVAIEPELLPRLDALLASLEGIASASRESLVNMALEAYLDGATGQGTI